MPVFISYSHENKEFVDQLAMQLVQQNVHIWLDRWELSLGDSLIDKVQDAADGASALLVILSNASVDSEWCKKEALFHYTVVTYKQQPKFAENHTLHYFL